RQMRSPFGGWKAGGDSRRQGSSHTVNAVEAARYVPKATRERALITPRDLSNACASVACGTGCASRARMAKRSSKPNGSTTGSRVVKSRSSRRATTGAIEQRVVAAAEQIGRIVGTVQAKTEGWLGRTGSSAEKQARTSPRPPRSGGVVDAP